MGFTEDRSLNERPCLNVGPVAAKLLLVIAEEAAYAGACTLSNARLAERTGARINSVKYALRTLEERRLIEGSWDTGRRLAPLPAPSPEPRAPSGEQVFARRSALGARRCLSPTDRDVLEAVAAQMRYRGAFCGTTRELQQVLKRCYHAIWLSLRRLRAAGLIDMERPTPRTMRVTVTEAGRHWVEVAP